MNAREDHPSIGAVDLVPRWAALIGAVSVLATALLPLAGGDAVGGLALVVLMLASSAGVTLGVCGVLLALRDGRHLRLALAGTAASLALPLYLLAGMPGS